VVESPELRRVFKTVSLLDLLAAGEEEIVRAKLASFSCPINKDIEAFLREKAIEFSKASLARTFLVVAEYEGRDVLAGFFTLAGKSLLVSDFSALSKTYVKKIQKFSEYYDDLNAQILHVILIAQLGKNYTDGYDKLISGAELLTMACEKVAEAQAIVAGKVVCVECADHPSLIDFYTRNEFRRFQNRPLKPADHSPAQGTYLVQLLRYL